MIYTVTLNPSLDYFASADSFTAGKTNRTHNEYIVPGGKGLNVSMMLARLGMESTAIAHTAYVNKVPFVIVRFISDNAEDESGKAYDEFEAEAAEHSANILKNALLQIQNHMNRE